MTEENFYKTLFVGVDVHKDTHAVVTLDCFGRKQFEMEIKNEAKDFFDLIKKINGFKKPVVISLEDGYGYGRFLAEVLAENNFEVKLVSPILIDRARQNETHPEKNDFLDALAVAKVSIQRIDTLPNYIVATSQDSAIDLKSLVTDHDFLVKEKTRLKNQLHRLLHQSYASYYRKLFKGVFAKRALNFWFRFPSLEDLKRSRLSGKPTWVKELKLFEIPRVSQIKKNQIRRKVKRILEITEEMKEIDQEMEELLEKTNAGVKDFPGCGTYLRAKVLAEIKDINRFATEAKLAKYAGASPREHSSGKKKRYLRTRAGNRRLNKALQQIAISQIGNRGNCQAKIYYQKKLDEGKTKKQALGCLKRQIIKIIYQLLKEQRSYFSLYPKYLGQQNLT